MWRVTCRMHSAGQTASMPMLRPAAAHACSCHPGVVRHGSTDAHRQPPMSQPLDRARGGERKLPPIPPPPGADLPPPGSPGSGWGKKVAIGAAVAGLGGGLLLANDECTRLALVENYPSLESLFDTVGWSTKKKSLPPPPVVRKPADNYNVMDIANRGVAQLQQPTPVKTSNSSSDVEKLAAVKKPVERRKSAPAVVTLSQSQGDTPLLQNTSTMEEERPRGALITNIAEDSVRFLMTGKRPAEEELSVQRYRDQVRRSREEREREAKEAETARQLSKRKADEAECEARRVYAEEKQRKNCELEQLLSREISRAMECAQRAVHLNNMALEACKLHISELQKAMDADTEYAAQKYWPRICHLRDDRIVRVKEASEATEAAQAYLRAFLDCIEVAKKEEMTKGNHNLESYKQQGKQICSDLSQAIAMRENADSMDKVMKHYYHVMQKNRAEFNRELEENLPNVEIGNKGR